MSDIDAQLARGYDRLASKSNKLFIYQSAAADTIRAANISTLFTDAGKWGIAPNSDIPGQDVGLLQIFPSLNRTLDVLNSRTEDDDATRSVQRLRGKKNTQTLWESIFEQDPDKQVTTTIGTRRLEGVSVGSDILFRL
jgi:hypothetical protein